MSFDNPQFIWAIYTISNIIGLAFLFIAYKWPRVARLMFVLLFGWASWFNYTTCHSTPEIYLNYADSSIQWYSYFIKGWFSGHITLFVSLIAIGQGLIAAGLLLKGALVKWACIGIIVFLLGIAPLGINAAFPFSITVSIAAYLVMKKASTNYLWVGHS